MRRVEMYHFIVNPSSSSGRSGKIWQQIEKKLQQEEIPYLLYLTEGENDARRFASEITMSGEEVTIVVCGGDGTVNEVVCGIRDYSRVILGYLPAGSSNDLARDLSMPKDPMRLIETILHPKEITPMDIGKVTYEDGGKNFSVSMGIGFDAAICHEALHSKLKVALNKVGLGKLTYLGIALKQLVGAGKTSAVITLDDNKQIRIDRIMFVTCMVHRYEGGGFMFCPKADYADGWLDVLVVGDLSKWKVLRVLPAGLKGNAAKYSGLNEYRAKKIEIKVGTPQAVHVDGESAGVQKRVCVTQEEKQLRLITG